MAAAAAGSVWGMGWQVPEPKGVPVVLQRAWAAISMSGVGDEIRWGVS